MKSATKRSGNGPRVAGGVALVAALVTGLVLADQPTPQAQTSGTAASAAKASGSAVKPHAKTAKTTVPSARAGAPYEVKGFRDLTFGSSEAQVRNVLKTSFNVPDSEVKRVENIGEGTVVLSAPLSNVEPGPGRAMVYAIMGHDSKKLIQVNLVWAAKENTPAMRDTYGAAAMRFGQYFDGFNWADGTAKMQAAGKNALVVFGGNDQKTGSVRVLVDGVEYDSLVDGQSKRSEAPETPPVLQIIYVGDRVHPDVIHITENSF